MALQIQTFDGHCVRIKPCPIEEKVRILVDSMLELATLGDVVTDGRITVKPLPGSLAYSVDAKMGCCLSPSGKWTLVEKPVTGVSEEDMAAHEKFWQMIDGSITEYYDDELTSLAAYAFENKRNLTYVELPNVKIVNGYAFQGCTSLHKAVMPLVETLEHRVFIDCPSLEEIDYPQATYIGQFLATSCKALKRVNLPLAKTIGQRALGFCDALEELSLPSCTTVDKEGLYNNTSLRVVEFCAPKVSIGQSALYKNTALERLILRGEEMSTLGSLGLNGSLIASGSGYIYVPSALIETYKANSGWETYANQFRALEDYTVDGTITGALDEAKIAA